MTVRGGPASVREAFLDAVAANLRLDPDTELDVLDELGDHLHDSIDGLRGAGLSAEEAEHRAVGGLGDPLRLARSIRHAHQKRRRLLAAVGGGVLGAADGLARQVVPIFAVLSGATFAMLLLAEALRAISGIRVSMWNLGYGSELPVAALIGFGGSRRMSWAIARAARRPLGAAAIVTALAGGTTIAAWTLIGPPVTFTDLTLAADVTALGAWLAGCASVGSVPDLRMTNVRWLVASFLVGTLMLGARVATATPSPNGAFSPARPDLSRIAAASPWIGGLANASGREGVDIDGIYRVDLWNDPETTTSDDVPLNRARNARLELWPAIYRTSGEPFPSDEVGDLDPRAARPLRTAALSRSDDHLVGSLRFDDIRGLRAAWIVTTATIDGRRYVIDSSAVAPAFRGNVLDWLRQPADPLATAR
jgi:hypothetical protein